MNKKYLEQLIERCWCLEGYTPEKLEEDLKKAHMDELTGNLWEDVPYLEKDFLFELKCAEEGEEE